MIIALENKIVAVWPSAQSDTSGMNMDEETEQSILLVSASPPFVCFFFALQCAHSELPK